MQDSLSEKLEALTETLGIMFLGCEITLDTDGDVWAFEIDGKRLRFGEHILKSHDVNYVLSACHAAITELKARPERTTVTIVASPFAVDDAALRPKRRAWRDG
jgi:hypothetical protein